MTTMDHRGFLDNNSVSFALVTQNIGAIEAVGSTLPAEAKFKADDWIKACAEFVTKLGDLPDVLVLHLQEVGGKKYNAAFNEYFSKVIPTVYPSAGWCSGLLMPREECDTTFTAMATVIFVSKRLVPVTSLLSMRHRIYVPVEDDPHETTGSLEYLFHGAKFSNAEKSRKGFLLTSLRLGSQVMNFVNVHLFHDADNSVAVSESPSPYVQRRREALCEAVTEISPLISKSDALFFFGDFNLRLDGFRLLKFVEGKFDSKISMGKKEVKASQEVYDFFNRCEGHLDELRSFDLEGVEALELVAATTGIELGEFERNFRPTYPYAVPEGGGSATNDKRLYNVARLPAWCDRVLFNPAALSSMLRRKIPNIATREQVTSEEKRGCAYSATHLSDMDHDAVFLTCSLDI